MSWLVGIAMAALTIVVHAVGAHWWLDYARRRIRARSALWGREPVLMAIAATGSVLLLLHMIEALLWALLYRGLEPDRLTDFGEAAYFSFVTFATLGYGDLTLTSEWRVLTGMQAMVGILVFGISTALLIAVIQRAWHPKASGRP